jgi:hypothetical protein
MHIDRERLQALLHLAWVPVLIALCFLTLMSYARAYPRIGSLLGKLGWAISSS